MSTTAHKFARYGGLLLVVLVFGGVAFDCLEERGSTYVLASDEPLWNPGESCDDSPAFALPRKQIEGIPSSQVAHHASLCTLQTSAGKTDVTCLVYLSVDLLDNFSQNRRLVTRACADLQYLVIGFEIYALGH